MNLLFCVLLLFPSLSLRLVLLTSPLELRHLTELGWRRVCEWTFHRHGRMEDNISILLRKVQERPSNPDLCGDGLLGSPSFLPISDTTVFVLHSPWTGSGWEVNDPCSSYNCYDCTEDLDSTLVLVETLGDPPQWYPYGHLVLALNVTFFRGP